MNKKFVALFFTIVFLTFTVVPAIMVAINDNIDVSIFYGCAEEEKETEKNTTVELIIPFTKNETISFTSKVETPSSEYRFKNYSNPHIHLIFPPPEFI